MCVAALSGRILIGMIATSTLIFSFASKLIRNGIVTKQDSKVGEGENLCLWFAY